MRQTVKSSIVLALGTAAIAALVWTIVGDRKSQPYTVQRSALSGWTVVVSHGAEPWVIAAQPPAAMAASLFRQLTATSDVPLMPPDLTVLPLVTRSDDDDALQGVYGVESLIRMAHEAGIDESVFEPVCVARQLDSGQNAARRAVLRGVLITGIPRASPGPDSDRARAWRGGRL